MSQHPYTRGYFEGDGTGYLGLYRDFVTHWRMIKAIKGRNPSSVLDVGASRGYICKHLEAELGIKAVAMDISEHAWHSRATDNFVLYDVRKAPWPFKDKEFDLVVSMSFMEHLTEEEIPTVMKEMARVSNRAYLTITFEKTPQDIDKTHRTFQSREAWLAKFKEYAPDYPVEIMSVEEAKKMEQTPIELPQPDGLVKLNAGSWMDMFHYGWINIDVQDLSQFAQVNGYNFRQIDVRKEIPYLNSSVDIIVASHFMEHLTREEGEKFLAECLRVLKPNGLIRLVIPDSKLLAEKYLKGEITEYKHVNIGVENAPDDAEAFYHLLLAGHQTIYDYNSLKTALEKVGFQEVKRMEAFKSQSEAMQKQTISMYCTLSCYLEGKKPNVVSEKTISVKDYLEGKIAEGKVSCQ